DLPGTQLGKGGDQAADLVVAEKALGIALVAVGQAVFAAKVADVGDRQPEVGKATTETVDQLAHVRSFSKSEGSAVSGLLPWLPMGCPVGSGAVALALGKR